MKKSIFLDISVSVEGEDEAAHDFAQSTTQVIREIIETGAVKHAGLTIKVRSIKEKS